MRTLGMYIPTQNPLFSLPLSGGEHPSIVLPLKRGRMKVGVSMAGEHVLKGILTLKL